MLRFSERIVPLETPVQLTFEPIPEIERAQVPDTMEMLKGRNPEMGAFIVREGGSDVLREAVDLIPHRLPRAMYYLESQGFSGTSQIHTDQTINHAVIEVISGVMDFVVLFDRRLGNTLARRRNIFNGSETVPRASKDLFEKGLYHSTPPRHPLRSAVASTDILVIANRFPHGGFSVTPERRSVSHGLSRQILE